MPSNLPLVNLVMSILSAGKGQKSVPSSSATATPLIILFQVLGALVNGVFLLALCFSIFLEAIQRFFSVQGRLRAYIVAYSCMSDCNGLQKSDTQN